MPDIPISKTYLHDLKKLYSEHEKKSITDEEFSQRSDELREREAKSHDPAVGRILLMEKLGDAEKEIADEVKKEFQRQQAEYARQLQQQQQEEQDEELRSLQEQMKRTRERYNYRRKIDNYINRLEGDVHNWQVRYTWLQIILLIFSATTAGIAGIDGVPRGVVAFTGIIATIAGGLLTTFKIQDRIYASRKAVAEMRLECQKYDYHIEEYKNTNIEDAYLRFSKYISEIQGQQMLQEVEFWNPKKETDKEEKTIQKDQQDKGLNEISEKTSQEGKLSDKASEEERDETAR